MKKYSIEEVLKDSGYTWVDIEEMSEQEIQQAIVENNFRYCERCCMYVHTDNFNGEQNLCDGCI